RSCFGCLPCTYFPYTCPRLPHNSVADLLSPRGLKRPFNHSQAIACPLIKVASHLLVMNAITSKRLINKFHYSTVRCNSQPKIPVLNSNRRICKSAHVLKKLFTDQTP